MLSFGKVRYLLILLATLVVIGIIATVSFNTKSSSLTPTPAPQQTLPNNVDIALNNAHFTEMRGAIVAWELVATNATYSKKGDLAALRSIIMTFPATKSAGKCTVTAREGTYSNTTKNVTLKGNVHVETENGASFDTETLDYNATRSLFTTNEIIHCKQAKMILTARGMELDVKHQKARFLKEIDAVISELK